MDKYKAELQDGITEVSNETGMAHDYASGLHYYIVESGGYLRNGLGLSNGQWIHVTTLERANLVASRTMGSVECMRLIRQRGLALGMADQTDQGEQQEDSESDMDDDMEVEPSLATTVATPQDLAGNGGFSERWTASTHSKWRVVGFQHNSNLGAWMFGKGWHVPQWNFQAFQRLEEECRRSKQMGKCYALWQDVGKLCWMNFEEIFTKMFFLWKMWKGWYKIQPTTQKQRRNMWTGRWFDSFNIPRRIEKNFHQNLQSWTQHKWIGSVTSSLTFGMWITHDLSGLSGLEKGVAAFSQLQITFCTQTIHWHVSMVDPANIWARTGVSILQSPCAVFDHARMLQPGLFGWFGPFSGQGRDERIYFMGAEMNFHYST